MDYAMYYIFSKFVFVGCAAYEMSYMFYRVWRLFLTRLCILRMAKRWQGMDIMLDFFFLHIDWGYYSRIKILFFLIGKHTGKIIKKHLRHVTHIREEYMIYVQGEEKIKERKMRKLLIKKKKKWENWMPNAL